MNPSPEAPPTRLRNPWWLPPFLGRVPVGVGPTHMRLLGAVTFALVFEEYDLAMITSVLPEIRDAFGVPEPDLPLYLGLVRLGALPAIALIPFADRISPWSSTRASRPES